MTASVWFRKKIIVNTDPERRCYNGCNASEAEVWTEWEHICTYTNREIAKSSVRTFQSINPGDQYEIREGV